MTPGTKKYVHCSLLACGAYLAEDQNAKQPCKTYLLSFYYFVCACAMYDVYWYVIYNAIRVCSKDIALLRNTTLLLYTTANVFAGLDYWYTTLLLYTTANIFAGIEYWWSEHTDAYVFVVPLEQSLCVTWSRLMMHQQPTTIPKKMWRLTSTRLSMATHKYTPTRTHLISRGGSSTM